ncbi:hypothetical protein AWENTII_008246 [Aspergillus wentii]
MHLQCRSLLNNTLVFCQIISVCFMTWKALTLWTNTPYPAMVVITESMAPAFRPGDILFMSNHDGNVAIGDLPVCWPSGRSYPMVHRVVRVLYQDTEQFILTKGDNNLVDDTMLYPDGQEYLHRNEIIGFVRGYVPFLGWFFIILQNPSRLRDIAMLF